MHHVRYLKGLKQGKICLRENKPTAIHVVSSATFIWIHMLVRRFTHAHLQTLTRTHTHSHTHTHTQCAYQKYRHVSHSLKYLKESHFRGSSCT